MHSPLPNFDALVALHRDDPEALEHFRRHLLREAIASAPQEHQASLEQLLQRIEDARSTAHSPMEAAVSAFRLMQESVSRLANGWEQALEAVAGLQTTLVLERLRGAAKSNLPCA